MISSLDDDVCLNAIFLSSLHVCVKGPSSDGLYSMRKTPGASHPFFFLLMALVAMTELGFTGFLINAGNEAGFFPSPRFHKLLILFCFNAVWTTLFATSYVLWFIDGAVHILANIASSVAWLFVNTVLWAVASSIMLHTRTGGNCAGTPTISRCRQSLTVEALGWTELGLSAITLLATCLWIRVHRRRRHSFVNDSRRLV